MRSPLAPRAIITEDELAAIAGQARRLGHVPGPTALRMVSEIRKLRIDLLRVVLMGLELTREEDSASPPGAPRLADFDS